MKYIPKILSCALVLALLVSVASLGVYAKAPTVQSGDFAYNVKSDGTAEITGYHGSGGSVAIPSTLDGKRVTSIGQWAFLECTALTSVSIPDGVTDIGYAAFYNCGSLESISIPDSVTSSALRRFFAARA